MCASLSPERPNIFYEVRARTTIDSDLSWLLSSLRENLQLTPRVIVYCQSLDMCSELYAYFHFKLGEKSYYPAGAEHLSRNHIFGMFHACTPQLNKEVIYRAYWILMELLGSFLPLLLSEWELIFRGSILLYITVHHKV